MWSGNVNPHFFGAHRLSWARGCNVQILDNPDGPSRVHQHLLGDPAVHNQATRGVPMRGHENEINVFLVGNCENALTNTVALFHHSTTVGPL